MDSHGKRKKSLYEILNVSRDCTDKEIRNAFVQLSKKFHPDVQKGLKSDPKQTAQFVEITEAYQTLSKAKLRMEYDVQLQTAQSSSSYETGSSSREVFHRPWEIKPDYAAKPGPYYGIKGLKRMSNSKVAWALIVLGVAGSLFGFISVKHSFSLNQKRLDHISAQASEHHQKIRADVRKYTKDEQLRRVVERISNQAER